MMKWVLRVVCLLPVGIGGIAATALRAEGGAGFRAAEPGYAFSFPRDHGSHPDFRIEWWYLTGHLESGGGRFGFQATFFRKALAVPGESGASGGTGALFGDGQAYLAHMALLDARTGEFIYEERLNREGWDAEAAVGDLRVRNGNWKLAREPGPGTGEKLRLRGSVRADAQFELELAPLKPRVIFGENGVSRKAEDPSAASHYITFSRLAASGRIQWGGRELPVSGSAWMDHEFSSSQLGADQVGWNWAGIQLDDGREIMAYLMRTGEGKADAFSALSWIAEDGTVRRVAADAFRWESVRQWTSPATGATYPVESVIVTEDPRTRQTVSLRLEPLSDRQELAGEVGGIAYWEGACDVLDAGGRTIGRAFVELTGFDGRLRGQLR